MHILDVIERGNGGLIKASGQFSMGRGYSFTTCVTVCVQGAIDDFGIQAIQPTRLAELCSVSGLKGKQELSGKVKLVLSQ